MLPAPSWRRWAFGIGIYPSQTHRAAIAAAKEVLAVLKRDGDTTAIENRLATFTDREEAVEFEALARDRVEISGKYLNGLRPPQNLRSGLESRRNGADDRQRLLDRRIVDMAVRHHPQRLAAPGAAFEARAVERRHPGLGVAAGVADLDHDDVGLDQPRIGEARIDRVQPFGEALGAAVVLGEPDRSCARARRCRPPP